MISEKDFTQELIRERMRLDNKMVEFMESLRLKNKAISEQNDEIYNLKNEIKNIKNKIGELRVKLKSASEVKYGPWAD